jgi:hypothetical protein
LSGILYICTSAGLEELVVDFYSAGLFVLRRYCFLYFLSVLLLSSLLTCWFQVFAFRCPCSWILHLLFYPWISLFPFCYVSIGLSSVLLCCFPFLCSHSVFLAELFFLIWFFFRLHTACHLTERKGTNRYIQDLHFH